MEGRGTGPRVVLPNHKGLACRKPPLHLFFRQREAVLVILHDDFAVHGLFQRIQTRLVAEAVVGLALLDELLRVLHINARAHALTLHIGAVALVLVRSLIVQKTGFLERAVNNLGRSLDKSALVGVLDAENEGTVRVLGNEIRIECCPQVSDMHAPGGTRRISGSDFHVELSLRSARRSFSLILARCVSPRNRSYTRFAERPQ